MADVYDVLALDVSSTATGWAIRSTSLDFGVITPTSKGAAIVRIEETVDAVARELDFYRPRLVLMEWSSGKVHGAIKRRTSGLSVLGASQGAVWQLARGKGYAVETVGETWTKAVPKAERAARMRLVYPAYGKWASEGNDGGLDCADAIGLLEWHRGQRLTTNLMERGESR